MGMGRLVSCCFFWLGMRDEMGWDGGKGREGRKGREEEKRKCDVIAGGNGAKES
jgi:hypothetical protein